MDKRSYDGIRAVQQRLPDVTIPLQRIRFGAVVLGIVLIVGLVGYRIAGYDWIGALWMVVVTISSVGYGERSTLPPAVQLFTILIIVFGMSAAAYAIGGFIQLTLEGEIQRALGRRRMTVEIERLKNHIIICGFGRMGQVLASDLTHHRRPVVVIDMDPERVEEAKELKLLCLHGDAAADTVLLEAGVERADALVTALPSDAENVFITLSARNLNPDLQIIARAELGSSERKLKQAGADKVVTPAITGARLMSRLITRPSTADLMELVAESSFEDIELDEFAVPADSRLVDTTVRDSEALPRYHLLVVAVKQADGEMAFNPGGDFVFQSLDNLIVMGRAEDIESFRKAYEL